MALSSHVLVHLRGNAACTPAVRQPAVLQSKQEQQQETLQQQQERPDEYPVHDKQQQYNSGDKLSDEMYTSLLAVEQHLQQRWGVAAAAVAAGTAHSSSSTSDSSTTSSSEPAGSTQLLRSTSPVQQTAKTMLSAATAEAAVAGMLSVCSMFIGHYFTLKRLCLLARCVQHSSLLLLYGVAGTTLRAHAQSVSSVQSATRLT
jgi:hypothetical protein